MLQENSLDDAVAAVQPMLAFLDYRGYQKRGNGDEAVPIKDDGQFGDMTELAVLAFQTEQGL